MIDNDRPINLVLFFTRGMSLQAWDAVGMLSREVKIYRRLQGLGVHVSFITYGDGKEQTYSKMLPDIRICSNQWGFPQRWYERLLPFLHRQVLQNADLIKTNQTNGADIAIRSAKFYHKPMIARCGYMWSKNAVFEKGSDSPLSRKALATERKVFSAADKVVVTTKEMQEDIWRRFGNEKEKVSVIPNYVDTEVFRPLGRVTGERPRLCFVGRLAPEKNLDTLLEVVDGLNVDLEIIGQGPLSAPLEKKAAGNPRVRFLGRKSNEELPAILNGCTAFIFPSFYEGHPKSLIEAMACGLPVITTDVPGINGIVKHGQTGWLCQPNKMSLREGIMTVLNDPGLQLRMGDNARRFVVENYSMDKVVEEELRVYLQVLCGMPRL